MYALSLGSVSLDSVWAVVSSSMLSRVVGDICISLTTEAGRPQKILSSLQSAIAAVIAKTDKMVKLVNVRHEISHLSAPRGARKLGAKSRTKLGERTSLIIESIFLNSAH